MKRPIGVLYSGKDLDSNEFLELLRSAPLLVAVGDRVTDFAHQIGRDPDVQIVDKVERRVTREAPKVPYSRLVKAKNPAGSITAEAIAAVRRAMKGKMPVRVLVEGEEDLLAIPAIEAAPLGSILIYGQPGLGVVLVEASERAKVSATRTLGVMGRGT